MLQLKLADAVSRILIQKHDFKNTGIISRCEIERVQEAETVHQSES